MSSTLAGRTEDLRQADGSGGLLRDGRGQGGELSWRSDVAAVQAVCIDHGGRSHPLQECVSWEKVCVGSQAPPPARG